MVLHVFFLLFFFLSFLWVYYFNFFLLLLQRLPKVGRFIVCIVLEGRGFHELIGISPFDGFSWVLLNSFLQISH